MLIKVNAAGMVQGIRLLLYRMTKRRINLSIAFMLLAIVALVVFQSYWLYKSFGEEQKDITIRTNILFREAITQCQAEKLQLDTNVHFRVNGYGATVTLDAVKRRVKDSAVRYLNEMKSVTVMKPNEVQPARVFHKRIDGPDSLRQMIQVFKTGPGAGGIIRILEGVDSLQDTITVQEISIKYSQLLQREKLKMSFHITRAPGVLDDEFMPPRLEEANWVTMGFKHPFTYTLYIEGITGVVLQKISLQILVSVLLVGITILSFVLLLRNLMQQQRLTLLKNEFISNITHELKTPIATVSVAIEALKNFNALQDPQRTKEYLDISASELQRLSLLVDKVLKLSMFEKHQIELRAETFNLEQLVQEVIASMKLQFEKYSAQVSVQLHGDDFTLKADRLHITSVIFNLLDNALKYSKANPVIQVDLFATRDQIEMSVTDNGIGISHEYRQKVFDKFFRVPAGDTHNVKGYGLGLSYVAYVASRHHGTIDLESQPGIGSRFIIKLPVVHE
jgi:two-component system phosphate regulon sensor histidine kinase PhoR